MKTVAVIASNGGTGRTTLAANLALMLSRKARAIAVDLDRRNVLGLHFGMDIGERHGLAAVPELTAADVVDFLRAGRPPVPYIPFGACSEVRYDALEAALRRRHDWLGAQLAALAPPATQVAVLDTPVGPSPWVDQALRAADLVLVVAEPSPVTYALLPEIEHALAPLANRNGAHRGAWFVLNRVDPRRRLARDIRDALGNALGDRLLDVTLTDDEAVREALASRRTAVEHAPNGAFAGGLRTLADWVHKTLELA